MIRLLDKKTADKIAAGEVIDRPVSIVKELVENSLDAGATAITIEIRDGGISYIRITDNGCGIPADEAELAFRRHATSKITSEKDLDCIGTLGFRGEALASICAVARVELITKTADAKAGCRLITEGSEILENTSTGCPDGTTITVKDLFYNVPARHKFLNSAASESRRIIDFASRIALSYPDVRFQLINGSNTVFTTSGRGNILANIISIYGSDLAKGLIPVEKSENGFTLKGFVSDPGTSLPSRNRQIFCVNGRIIASSVMERALDKAYKERLFQGRFPIAFLFLAMPTEKLDVNIHPTKREVRFDDNAEVEDFVTMAVSQSLQGKEAIPSIAETPKMSEKAFVYEAKKEAPQIARPVIKTEEKGEQV
ncbi:MAG: DNA mismatch repair endonuclease MutL, partial [Bacillota bacterium]|nr:DNA mismatch repair endonuclease MutL [Bacillota bacterium]